MKLRKIEEASRPLDNPQTKKGPLNLNGKAHPRDASIREEWPKVTRVLCGWHDPDPMSDPNS
jgi:hypothetical protein